MNREKLIAQDIKNIYNKKFSDSTLLLDYDKKHYTSRDTVLDDKQISLLQNIANGRLSTINLMVHNDSFFIEFVPIEDFKLSKQANAKFTLILQSSDVVRYKMRKLLDEGKEFDSIEFKKDLQFDSLDAVALVMEFEKQFDCCIPDDKVHLIKTIADAKQFLANCLIDS